MGFWTDEGYDERQVLERYRTGFQAFIIVMLLMLTDAFIKEKVYLWSTPLDSVVVILITAFTFFSVKTIWRDAYFAQNNRSGKILFGIFGVLLLIILIMTPFEIAAGDFHLTENGRIASDGVFCFTTAYIASVVITWLLRQWKNKREAEEI